MTTRFSNSILHKTEEVGLVDNNLIRSIATNIITVSYTHLTLPTKA